MIFTPFVENDPFIVEVTDEYVQVTCHFMETSKLRWEEIELIQLFTSDLAPYLPSAWLGLGKRMMACLIPRENEGFQKVYDVVSKFEGFDVETFEKNLECEEDCVFELYKKDPKEVK